MVIKGSEILEVLYQIPEVRKEFEKETERIKRVQDGQTYRGKKYLPCKLYIIDSPKFVTNRVTD